MIFESPIYVPVRPQSHGENGYRRADIFLERLAREGLDGSDSPRKKSSRGVRQCELPRASVQNRIYVRVCRQFYESFHWIPMRAAASDLPSLKEQNRPMEASAFNGWLVIRGLTWHDKDEIVQCAIP